MTSSFDEVHRLMLVVNTGIQGGQAEQWFDLAKTQNLVPTRVQVLTYPEHPSTIAIDSTGKAEEKSNQLRFLMKAIMKITVESGQEFEIKAASKPCLTAEQARINACHELLLAMSNSPYFAETFRRQCKLLFSIAYMRGRELSVGDLYPFPEDVYLEFKGCAEQEQPQSYKAFLNKFGADACFSIAAFVNTRIITERRPLAPCRIVFGVHDKSRQVHGIQLEDDSNPISVADDLRQRLRQKFDHKVLRLNKGYESYLLRLCAAIQIHVDVVAHKKNTRESGDSKSAVVLITFALVMDEENDFTFPCLFNRKSEKASALPQLVECPYRRAKPGRSWDTVNLIKSDEDTIQKLFLLGVPVSIAIPEVDNHANDEQSD